MNILPKNFDIITPKFNPDLVRLLLPLHTMNDKSIPDQEAKIWIEKIINELVRLYQFSPNWLDFKYDEDHKLMCRSKYITLLSSLIKNITPNGLISLQTIINFLMHGPKIYTMSELQWETFNHIDLNISVTDYMQPYPEMLIEFPKNLLYTHLLIRRFEFEDKPILNGILISHNRFDDISVLLHDYNKTKSLQEIIMFDYDKLLSVSVDKSNLSNKYSVIPNFLCAAFNSCMALANFPHTKNYKYIADVERDKHFAKENSERGRKARERLASPVYQVSFDQNVVLHKQESNKKNNDSNSTGQKITCHWRRGHWAMQPHGPKMSLRKRIFKHPVLVNSELFLGNYSSTTVHYKGENK